MRQLISLQNKLWRAGFFALVLVALLPSPSRAQDWQLLHLSASSQHQGSKVWRGRFHGLNGQLYNATQFYQSTRPQFSANGLLARSGQGALTWLVPLSVDAGYSAKLYQASPLASLGFGAALRLGAHSLVSFRVDNIIVVGGKVSEQPCFDSFRRRFHCGSGLAWTEFEATNSAKDKSGGGAGQLNEPALHAKFIHKFSF